MLKIFAALLAVLVMTSQTFALSESEYKRLLSTSAEYRQAEAELSLTWKLAFQGIKKHEGMAWRELLDDQRDWIKTGRDEEAMKWKKTGLSWEQAYIKATRVRVEYLQPFINSN